MLRTNEFIVKTTHRALRYEDGKLTRVLDAGRYKRPRRIWFWRVPQVEYVLVDVRERELTIKGQEILTSDKVAVRVSILVQFKVVDPTAAIHNVHNYEERMYSDVQLAARRSLAAMDLEEILTNRNRLSEDILADVQDSAAGYGVAIGRAAVKDLIFPGNLQEIMNRVLAAERNSEAQLVDARTRAEVERIQAETQAIVQQKQAEVEAESAKLRLISEAEAEKTKAQLEAETFQLRQQTGQILSENPALLRLEEFKTLVEMGRNSNARIYLGLDQNGFKAKSEN